MDSINLTDFQKADIRIGTVIEASVPEWSHWVMRLIVDFGKEIGPKKVFAGIMKFYAPADLVGKQFPFIINIPAKKIGPPVDEKEEYSEAMMLVAVPDEEGKPILITPQNKVIEGSRIR